MQPSPLVVREQNVLVNVLREVRCRFPIPLLSFDTDNDTVFIDETVSDYCSTEKIEFTRCWPYRTSDQAYVEKNGDIVPANGRISPIRSDRGAEQRAKLYAPARLFVNAIQPRFKLAEKTRTAPRRRSVIISR